MNFLEFLSFAPLTISFVTILLITCILCLFSYYFLKVVNYCLNSEAWGGEVINPILLSSKVTSFFLKETEDWEVVKYNNDIHRLTRYGDSWVYKSDSRYSSYPYLGEGSWGGIAIQDKPEYAKNFKTKEEVKTWAKNIDKLTTVSEVSSRIPAKMYLLIPLIDLCLWTFTLAPVATLSITLTATTVFAIRWVSGRLAENVNKTKDNTSRIDDLETKEDK